jgi:hypothetical protein
VRLKGHDNGKANSLPIAEDESIIIINPLITGV